MAFEERRRSTRFTERLSVFMASASCLGGAYVLVDPVFSITWGNQMIWLGGDGFSSDLKGAVVSLILIGGWSAIKDYWFGATASTKTQSESIARIAEASAPVTAAAVAAATKGGESDEQKD